MIDANNFRRYVKDVTPGTDGPHPMSKRSRGQYVQRCALVWLIQQTLAEYALTNPQKLRVARDLSNPEVESQPQRWASLFEEKSEETKNLSTPLALIYALASDACALVVGEPEGDRATATDGNGDIDEEAA